jgi:hypothetical protein
VKALAERIAEWRRTREKRTAMPEELWQAAMRTGREHGVWRVAHALHVNYESLQRRVGLVGCERAAPLAGRFVELRPAELPVADGPGSTEVELSDGAGRTLRIRRQGPGAAEVLGLAERLWRGRP